ncbi:Dihydrofolate reductase [Sphaceloma murrayae]|uniref:Dihydrofolate reductase n=1 Tax=Sphaceloma murrayae TaxID=2082308 RepID=A0A2K1QK50_9PEZI|nr:Dihydrofolate reductase [Sphaceloma murrayae]
MSQPPLTLIVAATAKNGIGKAGGLPWPMLKKEMAYFARVTKRVPKAMATSDPSRKVQNVVIMGRKTWDSIPPKLRPLKERTNIIVTRQSADTLSAASHEDVIVASSIEDAMSKLSMKAAAAASTTPGRYYIIGGSSIYEAALKLPHPKNILLTRIRKEYECDTFFPVDLESDLAVSAGWRMKSSAELSDFVEEDVEDQDMVETVGGEEVRYRFTLYEQT